MIHDLSLYSRAGRPAAIAAFGLNRGPAVLALAQQGAAIRAGVAPDDILIEADGAPLPRPRGDVHGSFAPTERMIEALEAAFADGAADLLVRRGRDKISIRVEGVAGCASRFQVIPSSRRTAKADGRYVQLTSALVEYTRGDDELAALIAHELAHNILRHRARLNEAGVDREAQVHSPRDARLFQATELEADRLAVHLMERAGYDPAAALRLWTRQSREALGAPTGSHPDWATRIRVMAEEIAAIAAARGRGEQPSPPLTQARLDHIRN
jgi:predicted Zn-dependent protease